MSGAEINIARVKSEPIDIVQKKKEETDGEYSSVFPWQENICEAAGATKKGVKSLKRKSKKGRLGTDYVCLICNKEYVYEAFLTRHMVSKHRACEPIHQYKCRQCGAIFADEAGFEKHKSLFFEFLKHHIERVRPKEVEQENEVTHFEEFLMATAEEEREGVEGNTDKEVEEKESETNGAAEDIVDFLLADLNGPAKKKRNENSENDEIF